jgi:prepilin-type N-terminal cleavage/methylation domain-containing protein
MRTARGGHASRAQRGFTLFETIFVIAILSLVATGLIAMQPSVFKVQTNGRDQYVGLELMRGCAERILTVRRVSGFASVTDTLCDGMGGLGSFASNPTVTLTDSGGTTISTCSSATCTASVVIGKTSGPAASLSAITVRLSAY